MNDRVAIYSRYSSDNQRDASIDDQVRNCRRAIDSEDWEVVAEYEDKAISGGTAARPGYQSMLKAAAAREFDVLLIHDLSRFSRDQVESERAIRRLEHDGVRIIAVSDGYDSTSNGRKIQRGVKGLMNELYLDDLAKNTHRGLTGQAIKQYWCGGKPYGYRLVQDKNEGKHDVHGNAEVIGTRLVVDPEQSKVVVRIMAEYAEGRGLRSIASDLNIDGIPSPGSYWHGRTVRRANGWMGSTINSMVDNPLYRGIYQWNTTAWVKDPDTKKRTVRARPRSEWVIHPMPHLRIVDEVVWQRVRSRREALRAAAVQFVCDPKSDKVGPSGIDGLRHARAGFASRGGRRNKYSLSGLLKCGECGANFIIADTRSYKCSGNLDGGDAVCSNSLRVRRAEIEEVVIGSLRNDLLTPERIERFRRRLAARLNAAADGHSAADATRRSRLIAVEGEIRNLVNLAKAGVASASLAKELDSLEAEQARLTVVPRPTAKVVRMVPQAIGRYEAMVAELPGLLTRDPERARDILRRLLGEVRLVRGAGGLFAELSTSPERLMGLAGVTPIETRGRDGSGGRI